jgi:hypothetical protein
MDKQPQMYGRIAQWAAYLPSIFEMAVVHCAGIANAVADYTSRYPLPDPHRPDDGECLKEKGLTKEARSATCRHNNGWTTRQTKHGWTRQKRGAAQRAQANHGLTAYSVFTGIGSSMHASNRETAPTAEVHWLLRSGRRCQMLAPNSRPSSPVYPAMGMFAT